MTPEQVLEIAIAAGATKADQLIAALEAGGYSIVSLGQRSSSFWQLAVADNEKQIVAKRIADVRKSKGMTQESLAEILGCHVVTVSKLETSVMELTMDWVLRIAAALEIAPERLTKDRDIIHDPKSYVKDVLDRHNLTPGGLASKIGMSASTFTRAFNDPKHKFVFSTRTLQKIKEWDNAQP